MTKTTVNNATCEKCCLHTTARVNYNIQLLRKSHLCWSPKKCPQHPIPHQCTPCQRFWIASKPWRDAKVCACPAPIPDTSTGDPERRPKYGDWYIARERDLKSPSYGEPAPRVLAKCQCRNCERYLARDRASTANDSPQVCTECYDKFPLSLRCVLPYRDGIPLADIRGPESLSPVQVELLGMLAEECGEVVQRVGKILRWGFGADYAGSTMQQKLESEIGDVFCVVELLGHNHLVTSDGISAARDAKHRALQDDARGPSQRTRHAKIPEELEDEYMIGSIERKVRP